MVGIHDRKKHYGNLLTKTEDDSPNNVILESHGNSARDSIAPYVPVLGESIIPAETMARFFEKHEGGMRSVDGQTIYYFGIIDIFTHYGVMKKMEHFIKSVQYDSTTISCIPPENYADRFYEFMKNEVFS